jgi:hypothetical protein
MGIENAPAVSGRRDPEQGLSAFGQFLGGAGVAQACLSARALCASEHAQIP